MADRILDFHAETIVGDGTNQDRAYILDRDYTPRVLRVHARRAPDAADLQIDIKDDGVSIFTNRPSLQKGENTQDWWEDFKLTNNAGTVMEKYSVITFDVSQPAGAKGITVSLELEAELLEDEEDEDENDV